MAGSVRTYTLYPGGRTGLTNNSLHYRGFLYLVVATSVRQAFAVTHKGIWFWPEEDGNDLEVGIIKTYSREEGRHLWCGCKGHHIAFDLKHGVGKAAIMRAVAEHTATFEHLRPDAVE